MKTNTILAAAILAAGASSAGEVPLLYEVTVKAADGTDVAMAAFRGKVLLIVNVASKCGFTKQYEGLQSLHETYRDRGLVIIGFPCNQFGGQEPGSNEDIQAFCSGTFSVTFPVMAKIEVNGERTHPLYRLLKKKATGLLGSEAVKWNFTKFLVGSQGRVMKRYGSSTKPEALTGDIEKLLDAQESR